MIRLAHISDLHFSLQPFMEGLDPVERARTAIDALVRLAPQPDAVVITGDLTEHGSAEEYGALIDLLGRLEMPVLAIPGNHDRRAPFRQAFEGRNVLPSSGRLDFSYDLKGLHLVGLDTLEEGASHGALKPESLAFLDETLSRHPNQPTLIFFHHPPTLCGLRAMDDIRLLEGAAELRAIVQRRQSIVRILCGHVHRAIVADFAGTVLHIAPSVSHGVVPDFDDRRELRTNREPPAFLLHCVSGAMAVSHVLPVTPSDLVV